MDLYTNARQGIEYARTNQRLEALACLRQAVQTEPPHAEVWLWLAHVSPDINEYRNCVYQALKLDPYHMVARQMQEALGQFATQQAYQQAYAAPPQPAQPLPINTPPPAPTPSPYTTPPARYTYSHMTEKKNQGRFCLITFIALIGLAAGGGLAFFLLTIL